MNNEDALTKDNLIMGPWKTMRGTKAARLASYTLSLLRKEHYQ